MLYGLTQVACVAAATGLASPRSANGQRQHTMQRTTHGATDGTRRRACRVQVGYGDQYPVTILGRVAIIVSLGFSVVLSAMLVNTIIKKCAPTPEYH